MILSKEFTRLACIPTQRRCAQNQSVISIDLNGYTGAMKNGVGKVIEHMQEQKYQASIFEMTPQVLSSIENSLSIYPRKNEVLEAVRNKDVDALTKEISKIWQWGTSSETSVGREEKWLVLRNGVKTLQTFLDSIDKDEGDYEEGMQRELQTIIAKTYENMQKIQSLIESAIANIPTWGGSPVTITAEPSYSEYNMSEYSLSDTDTATVELSLNREEYFNPSFMIFTHDGKVEIDDVLEGGDDEFFKDPQVQADYFSLIGELKNPGGTQKSKTLTLYTARPSSDREKYSHATTIPGNIFLTNLYDHAEGLAVDLGGSQGVRDVWRIRIDSKYLTQTLDGPVKYYQVTVPDAPVKSMSLVSTGD